jgi:hypothetical protein
MKQHAHQKDVPRHAEAKGQCGLTIGSPEWSETTPEFAGVEEDDPRSPRFLRDRREKKVNEEQSIKGNKMTRTGF